MKRIISVSFLLMFAVCGLSAQELTIMHTNDTHSHIDPLRSGDEKGLGGVIERAAYVDSVRRADGRRHTLLLDAGDFSQGTSYFSILHGDLEIDLINAMGYDAVCLGNHEFDNGFDELARRLGNLRCPAVCANYTFTSKALSSVVHPYVIIRRGGLKIGIIGLLTDLSRMVEKKIADQTIYHDPVEVTDTYADYLKNTKHCDLVICLSHLGYDEDVELVSKTRNVDLVIGGHSHTFLEHETLCRNLDGRTVPVVTDGCWGLYAGKLNVKAVR